MGDYENALRDLTEAIRISPGYALGYRNRAVIRFSTGDKNGACADWIQAAKLGNPDAVTSPEQFCK